MRKIAKEPTTSSRKDHTIFVAPEEFPFISFFTDYLKIALCLMQISTISLYYIYDFFRTFISANRASTSHWSMQRKNREATLHIRQENMVWYSRPILWLKDSPCAGLRLIACSSRPVLPFKVPSVCTTHGFRLTSPVLVTRYRHILFPNRNVHSLSLRKARYFTSAGHLYTQTLPLDQSIREHNSVQ